MSKFKFAVLISGNGSNLGSMIEHVDNNKIKGNICCVFSNDPLAYGIERAKNAGLAYEVLDHREFKERDDFDSVLIGSPTNTHVDFIKKFSNRGKNILCEKPIDLDIKKVNSCIKIVKKNRTKCVIGFMRRFDPSLMKLKNLILVIKLSYFIIQIILKL